MKKKGIIGTLFVFCVATAGIGYTIYHSVNVNNQKHKASESIKLDSVKAPNELKDGEYTASAEGYEGPVVVKVVIKDGKIFSVDVVSHSETPEYYEMAKKILQTIVEKNTFNVDSISGATVTCDAIKVAVYKALVQAGAKTSDIATNLETESKELRDKEKAKLLAKQSLAVAGNVGLTKNNLKDGTFIGVGYGYNGAIRVSISIKNGVIYDARVISHSEDYPYFTWATSVLNKVIRGDNNIDTVSGATVSSRGILNAVRDALSKASNGNDAPQINLIDNGGEIQNIPRQKEPQFDQIKKAFSKLKDGTYKGMARGYYENSIEVEVTVRDGKISAIRLTKNGDDVQYFDDTKANILASRILDKQSTDVDVVSGATLSSKGYINAVVDALKDAYSSNATDADKFSTTVSKLVTFVGKEVSVDRIKSSLNLNNDVTVNIKQNANVDVAGNSEVVVEITFKDKSKKEFTIPVLVNKKIENSIFKFLSIEEVNRLDDNNNFKDGEYYGDSYGFVEHKPIPVKVTIKNGKIENIQLVTEEISRLKYVNANHTVDDGSHFAERFYTMSNMIQKTQKPKALAYKFGALRDAASAVMKEVGTKEVNIENCNAALDKVFGKHTFGSRKASLTEKDFAKGKALVKEGIFQLMKTYVKDELGYGDEDYDAVSGATFTATGTAISINNALLRTNDDIDFFNFKVLDQNFKTSYIAEEKLDLSTLKVEFYKKNKGKVEIPYSNFKANGLKVIDYENGSEIKDGMILNKENLKRDVVGGLRLKVVHEKSNSFKFLNSITITPIMNNCTIKSFQIREKGKGDWKETTGAVTDNFIQNLSISTELAKSLNKKELEFRLITTVDKTGEEKAFILEHNKNEKVIGKFDESLEFSLSVNPNDLKGEIPYSLRFVHFRIQFNPILSSGMAKTFNETPSILAVVKNDEITVDKVKALFKNLPEGSEIEILEKVDTSASSEEYKNLKIKIKFSDKTEKEMTVKVIVKDTLNGMADKYNEIPNDIVTIKGKDVTKDNVLKALVNLPKDTKIEVENLNNIDVNKPVDQEINVKLIFKDQTKKDIKVKVIVKDKPANQAEEFKILHPDFATNEINVVVKEEKYGDKLDSSATQGELKDLKKVFEIKYGGSNNISSVELLGNLDRSKVGKTKAKFRIKFSDAKADIEEEIAVNVTPYKVARIYRFSADKKEYRSNEKLNLSGFKVTLFMKSELDDNMNWQGNTPVKDIPYSDFELFGLKVIDGDNDDVNSNETNLAGEYTDDENETENDSSLLNLSVIAENVEAKRIEDVKVIENNGDNEDPNDNDEDEENDTDENEPEDITESKMSEKSNVKLDEKNSKALSSPVGPAEVKGNNSSEAVSETSKEAKKEIGDKEKLNKDEKVDKKDLEKTENKKETVIKS